MLVAVLILSVSISAVHADEGMWLLNQLKQLNLQRKGLEISNQEIYNPDGTSIVDAIVWLGGCSASFVSPEGLLVTNHHCAYGALQRASAKEKKDYISTGFLAESREKELPALGVEAYTLLQMTDVTDRVLQSAEGIKDLVQRERKIEEAMAKIKEEQEKDRDDMHG